MTAVRKDAPSLNQEKRTTVKRGQEEISQPPANFFFSSSFRADPRSRYLSSPVSQVTSDRCVKTHRVPLGVHLLLLKLGELSAVVDDHEKLPDEE